MVSICFAIVVIQEQVPAKISIEPQAGLQKMKKLMVTVTVTVMVMMRVTLLVLCLHFHLIVSLTVAEHGQKLHVVKE